MKRFAFVDWDLIGSTPLRHSYRRSWREFMRGRQYRTSAPRSIHRHISIEWDGIQQLTVRTGKLWRSKSSWKSEQLKGIVFGIREHIGPAGRSGVGIPDWLWFIHLTGKTRRSNGTLPEGSVLAEFLVSHQHDAPSTSRARVPHRVQKLLTWLEHCTGHRVHGPVLVTDEMSRRRILSHVD